MNKADKDKVIAALEKAGAAKLDDGTYLDKDCSITMAITIMRGLEDAAPVCNHEWFQTGAMLSNEKRCIKCGEWGKLYTSPQAAQTEAALCEMVRLSEDAGLYDDFQTEAQERPAYPEGDVVGLCVCGSWSGGRCLRCEWRAGSKP